MTIPGLNWDIGPGRTGHPARSPSFLPPASLDQRTANPIFQASWICHEVSRYLSGTITPAGRWLHFRKQYVVSLVPLLDNGNGNIL